MHAHMFIYAQKIEYNDEKQKGKYVKECLISQQRSLRLLMKEDDFQ